MATSTYLWIKVGLIGSWLATSVVSWGADAYSIQLRGTIDPATSHYLSRSILEAEKANAALILVELDTPGGLVTSVREMAQSLDRSKVPVVVYTTPGGASATSAGALLMISSHLAAMAPGTNIGAAHPVSIGAEMDREMSEKAVNDISAFARSMAVLRDRNPVAAGEVVTRSKSYTAQEALEARLIDMIAPDRESLWKSIHGRVLKVGPDSILLNTQPPPAVHAIEMSWGEKILHLLSHPNIAAILMSLGIILIYSEVSVPGIGLNGILGGICVIVAFIALQALSIETGGMIFLGLGTLLLIAEAFAQTGGILAGGGIVSLLLGFLWGTNTDAGDLRISPWVYGTMVILLGGGTLLIGYGVKKLRRLGPSDVTGILIYPGSVDSVSADGRSGTVRIGGELWNFTSSHVLHPGDEVVATKSSGLTLEVRPTKETPLWKTSA